MANEKMRDQDQGMEQDRGKAAGAGAQGGTQERQDAPGRERQGSETGGQGGGVQGGQRNPNPTQGQGSEGGRGQGSGKGVADQEEY